MEPSDLEMRDLIPAEPLLMEPGWPWWVWASGALVLLILILGGFLLYRLLRNTTPAPATVDFHGAYRRAVAEVESSSDLPPRDSALRISGAIRLYLATVCSDPSLYETHEEFISRHEALSNFSPEIREVTARCLTRLASVKYSKPRNEKDEDFAAESRSVLDQLHHALPA